MTPGDREHEMLRSVLEELRNADERAAPAFERLLARSRSRPPVAWRPGRLVLAAGAVFVGIGLIAVRFAHPASRIPLTVPREVVALSSWRPTTDVLLETSAKTLLRQTPQLSASLLDVNP